MTSPAERGAETIDRDSSPAARYAPLVAWVIVLLVLLLIPFKISSYGVLPPGDALRHVAKAFTDKPYTEILVLRSDYTSDQSPGWELILKGFQRATKCDADGLVTFSVVLSMLCLLLAPLPWLRRPEAWVLALLAQFVALPGLPIRLTQARPFMVTEGILIAVLLCWSRMKSRPTPLQIGCTIAGFALSTWIHGTWYLWALPVLAFAVARHVREAAWLAGCAALGTVVGAAATGNPYAFLKQSLMMAILVAQEHVPQWLLVGEFRANDGSFATLLLIAVVALFKLQPRFSTDTAVERPKHVLGGPIFWQVAICWILGLHADRFWGDWALPAVMIWIALQLEDITAAAWSQASMRRIATAALGGVALFLITTTDRDARYSSTKDEAFLDATSAELRGWMPEPGGIFYSADFRFFYNTFYANPRGEWRYVLGMEPAMMPDDDLRIFRRIQLGRGSTEPYQDWVKKMRREDRLEVTMMSTPPIPGLEWKYAARETWVGRLPR